MVIILIVVGVCSVLTLFGMDQEAILEETIAATEQTSRNLGASEEQIEQTVAQMRQTAAQGPGMVQYGGALIGTPIMTFIMVLLWAVYFKVIAAAMKLGGSFGDWHAFVWWTRVPLAVGAIITVIGTFLMNPGSTAEAAFLSPLSWFGVAVSPFMGALLYTFDLISIWIIVVAGIGFSVWTEKSVGVSIIIAAIPAVVFFVLGLLINAVLT